MMTIKFSSAEQRAEYEAAMRRQAEVGYKQWLAELGSSPDGDVIVVDNPDNPTVDAALASIWTATAEVALKPAEADPNGPPTLARYQPHFGTEHFRVVQKWRSGTGEEEWRDLPILP